MSDDLAALLLEERYGPPPLPDWKPRPWTPLEQAAHREEARSWWGRSVTPAGGDGGHGRPEAA